MTAVDVDALDKLREAADIVPMRQFLGDLYTDQGGRKVAVGPRGDPLSAADAALIVAAVNALPDLLAEVRRGRALRERLEGLAEEHQPVWAEDHFANERIRRDMCSCGESFHDACDVRIALDSLRAVVAAVDAS